MRYSRVPTTYPCEFRICQGKVTWKPATVLDMLGAVFRQALGAEMRLTVWGSSWEGKLELSPKDLAKLWAAGKARMTKEASREKTPHGRARGLENPGSLRCGGKIEGPGRGKASLASSVACRALPRSVDLTSGTTEQFAAGQVHGQV